MQRPFVIRERAQGQNCFAGGHLDRYVASVIKEFSKLKTWIFIAAALLACSSIAAEDSLRSALKAQVFADANIALEQANAAVASVLTPETYRRAGAIYKRADEAFAKGSDVDRVRDILQDATDLFEETATMAPTVEQFVSAAYQARQDAQ